MSASRPIRISDRIRRGRRTQRASGAQLRPVGTRLDDLVVITGFSGAGKSTAMAVFEDAGYFCVDNLPPEMLRTLFELFQHEGSSVRCAAVVCDVRGGAYFESLLSVLDELDRASVPLRVVFLEADQQTLLDRYKETRRRHPLASSGSVREGIGSEAALLAPIRERAEFVVDTGGLSAASLRRRLAGELLPSARPVRLAVTFTSFGHKHGPLRDADLALDVRFLPNPHYEPELRALTGLDPDVAAYVGRDGRLDELHRHLLGLLDYLLPQYVREGKSHLVVGIGCTGGRHRSVAIAERLAGHYRSADDYVIDVAHRDLDKPPRG